MMDQKADSGLPVDIDSVNRDSRRIFEQFTGTWSGHRYYPLSKVSRSRVNVERVEKSPVTRRTLTAVSDLKVAIGNCNRHVRFPPSSLV